MTKKKFKMPHVYTIFILLIVLSGLLTYIVAFLARGYFA